MTSKVTPAARQDYLDPQPTHCRKNTLIAIFIGAIAYSYAHHWTCDSLRGSVQDAWWEYQTAKNRCEDAQKIYQIYNAQQFPVWDVPDQQKSQEVLIVCAQRAKKACERAVHAKEKLDYREGWRDILFCNP